MTLIPQDVLGENVLSVIESWEALDTERAEIVDQQKALFDQAKEDGLNVKAIKQCIKLRKIDRETREAEEATLFNYQQAIGLK